MLAAEVVLIFLASGRVHRQMLNSLEGDQTRRRTTGVTLMVFYVFALQCVSTVAIVRRETNSWKWPFLQWLYMGLLAWGFAFLTQVGGRLLGWQ